MPLSIRATSPTWTCFTQLTAIGPPVVAINGNADDDAVKALLPATAEVELPGGRRLGLVHNGGPETGRLARLRKRFPGCTAVAFGHSHIPLCATAPDGFMIINPGSATDRRRQPHHSMVVIEVEGDGPLIVRFVNLDDDGADLPAAAHPQRHLAPADSREFRTPKIGTGLPCGFVRGW